VSAGLALLITGPSASAQTVFDPTYSPPVNTGGWVYNMAELLLLLGSLMVIFIVFGYLRFSPKFRATEEEIPAVRAPKVDIGAVAARPVSAAPKPMAVAVAAPAAAVAASAVVAAPAPAPAATQIEAAAPASEPATAADAPAADKPAHVEPDQETFDRVLQEQLDKGTDRRVAEGRARSAAVMAARKKAGG
jgi:hypothetical protein